MRRLIRAIALLWPALAPSWRFFPEVAPSPRVEFAVLTASAEPPFEPLAPQDFGLADADWRPYRPLPARLTAATAARRLFWNPWSNERLFMVSLAERVLGDDDAAADREIRRRIADEADLGPARAGRKLMYRIRLVYRDGAAVRDGVAHLSEAWPLDGPERRGRA